MPVTREVKPDNKATRQSTLDGKLALNVDPNPSSSRKKSGSQAKSKIERADTDAVLSLKPEFIELIAARQKNHEYRKYQMKKTVVRIWLYITAPTSAITHVMLTTLPKTPGQVCDPTGVGNDDFDAGKKQSKFGYPVLGLYRLSIPLKPDTMKQQFGLTPPQGLVYAPKKMIDDLPLDAMEKLF